MVVRVLTWNLFHGRDRPPDPGLYTLRSRLLRWTERNDTHVQVNRSLFDEFATVLGRAEWDVLLLQEAPPRWHPRLARRLGAAARIALTSRNLGAPLRAWLAERNPDLLGAWEGGSNQLLVRPPWRVTAVRRLTLSLRPERRVMLFARLERRGGGGGLCVGNLHASLAPAAAAREVMHAAEQAVSWAAGTPLILGGDLNLWPARAPELFAALHSRHGLAPPTAPDAIDHLLVRGAAVEEPPHRLPPGWRELVAAAEGERRLRLSDHAAVAARFAVG